jgi:hypothetical protein
MGKCDVSQSKYDTDLGVIGRDDQTSHFATIFGKARKYKIHHEVTRVETHDTSIESMRHSI